MERSQAVGASRSRRPPTATAHDARREGRRRLPPRPATAPDEYHVNVWGIRYIDAPIARLTENDDQSPGVDRTLYYATDAGHNVTAVVTEAGQLVERQVYDPYGRAVVLNGTVDPDGDEYTPDPDNASDVGNPLSFAGHRRDAETGLVIMRHRYHHPTLGRFVTRDPAGYADGLSLYQYCLSSPAVRTDPSGNQSVLGSDTQMTLSDSIKAHEFTKKLRRPKKEEEADRSKESASPSETSSSAPRLSSMILGSDTQLTLYGALEANESAQRMKGARPSVNSSVEPWCVSVTLGVGDFAWGASAPAMYWGLYRDAESYYKDGETLTHKRMKADYRGYLEHGLDSADAKCKLFVCYMPMMNVLPAGIELVTGTSARGVDYGESIDLRRRTASGTYVVSYAITLAYGASKLRGGGGSSSSTGSSGGQASGGVVSGEPMIIYSSEVVSGSPSFTYSSGVISSSPSFTYSSGVISSSPTLTYSSGVISGSPALTYSTYSSGLLGTCSIQSLRLLAPKSVKTPYGPAVQEQSAAALRVRSQIQQGGTVYKGGVLARSETGASQFLATESPLSPGYAGRYGLPPQNAQFDFIMGGRVRPGAPVITRSAPGIPPNPGGGIEGVINSGDFMIDWFHMP